MYLCMRLLISVRCSNCWKVTWYEDYVEGILSGEEQADEQILLYFNGENERQQLTDEE